MKIIDGTHGNRIFSYISGSKWTHTEPEIYQNFQAFFCILVSSFSELKEKRDKIHHKGKYYCSPYNHWPNFKFFIHLRFFFWRRNLFFQYENFLLFIRFPVFFSTDGIYHQSQHTPDNSCNQCFPLKLGHHNEINHNTYRSTYHNTRCLIRPF